MIFSHVLYQLSYLADFALRGATADEKPALPAGGAGELSRRKTTTALRPSLGFRPEVRPTDAVGAGLPSSFLFTQSRHGLFRFVHRRRTLRPVGRDRCAISAVVAGAGFEPATSGL